MSTGRKSKYDEATFPLLAEGYAREGLNDEQIAKNLGISPSTYYQYQIDYSEFSDAIKRGKKPVNVEVENALLKRALGFSYEERTTEVRIAEDGTTKPSVIRTTTRRIAPDVGAIAFWLKNREPDKWSDRQNMNLNLTQEQPLFPDVHTDDSDK